MLKVHVNIVLDELPSIGNIPDLGRKLATVRKYGVNVIPIVQLISQLDNRYSPAERDEIIGCCDTQIWLGSNDIASAEVLSERSGTMTVDISSKSENIDFDTQAKLTSSVDKRPVLTVDEVLRLPLDDEIIVLRGQNVMKLKKYKFSEYPDFEKVKNAEPITISNYAPEISNRYEHKEVKENPVLEEDIPRSSLSDDTEPKEKKPRSKSTGLKIQGDV